MKNSLVSIIVPVYNVDKYLNRCVDSILSQDYSPIEVILVDDGSTDDSPQICDRYLHADERVKVIHKTNGGLSSARNAGIDKASGKFILFIDSDDWVLQGVCRESVNLIEKTESDIVVFGYEEVNDDRVLFSHTMIQREICSPEESLEMLLSGKIQNYAWNKLYRRSLFEEIRYPLGRVWEDIGTTYLLFDKAKRISCTNRVFYQYYQRSDSIIHKPGKKAHIDILEQRLEQRDYILNKYPRLGAVINKRLLPASLNYCIHIDHTDNEMLYKKAEEILLGSKVNRKNGLSQKHNFLLFLFKYFNPIFELICRSSRLT